MKGIEVVAAEAMTDYPMLAATVLVQCGLASMLGALASRRWLRHRMSGWAHDIGESSRRTFLVGAVLGVLASMATLWLEAASMGDVSLASAGPTALVMLRETHYGHACVVGIVSLLVAGAAMSIRPAAGAGVAALGASVFAFTRTAVSHAAQEGDWTPRTAVDWLHLMLACLWVGSVFMGAFVALRPMPPTLAARADSAGWVASLSRTATVALVVILLTGALKAWWATPSVAQLIGSAYGAVLMVKVALVGIAVVLGGFNRLRVLSPLLAELHDSRRATPGPRRRFVRVLRIEASMLLLVFLAAAVLSATPPPGQG